MELENRLTALEASNDFMTGAVSHINLDIGRPEKRLEELGNLMPEFIELLYMRGPNFVCDMISDKLRAIGFTNNKGE